MDSRSINLRGIAGSAGNIMQVNNFAKASYVFFFCFFQATMKISFGIFYPQCRELVALYLEMKMLPQTKIGMLFLPFQNKI